MQEVFEDQENLCFTWPARAASTEAQRAKED